jgi:predicted nucleotidyltransferase
MLRTKNEVIDICKKYVEFVNKAFFVEGAWLFGSYAKDSAHEWSDIDIAILSADFDLIPKPIGMQILSRMAQQFDNSIEPVIIRPKERDELIIGTMAEEIIRSGLKIK